jgi:PAS domain-containing protein
MQRSALDRHALAGTVVGLVGGAVALGPEPGLAVAAPILAVGADDGLGLRTQVLWILGAGALGGVIGYAVATLAAPTATPIALGFGIAVGGGLGAVVRLLVVGDTEPQEPDDVTVSSRRTEQSTPDPQPVDLFDENPDPVLYFDDSGDGPVVRAANRAFEETFGVDSESVENAALIDALMVTERAEDVVTAAADAATFEAVTDCETATDEQSFRVRTVAVARGSGTRGYILYTALTT